jgi:hypothetical protein
VGAESAAVVPNPRRARAESMAGDAGGSCWRAGVAGAGAVYTVPLIVSRETKRPVNWNGTTLFSSAP